jgi:protein TonB
MHPFVLIAAAAAAMAQPAGSEPAPAGSDLGRPLVTLPHQANLAGYFGSQDYPKEARKKREEGKVTVRLIISSAGRVKDCQVLVSSGSPSLAATTCRLSRERIRFIPAHDSEGKPTEDLMEFALRWVLPG